MRNRPHAVAIVAVALAITLTGCGSDDEVSGGSGDGTRTIDVTMTDSAFDPTELEVTKGETVAFRFTNDDVVTHEAFIGSEDAQLAHHDEMTGSTEPDGHGGMGDMGDAESDESPHELTVEPGRTGALTYTFDKAGETLIGCHESGHWEAGMKLTVTVG